MMLLPFLFPQLFRFWFVAMVPPLPSASPPCASIAPPPHSGWPELLARILGAGYLLPLNPLAH